MLINKYIQVSYVIRTLFFSFWRLFDLQKGHHEGQGLVYATESTCHMDRLLLYNYQSNVSWNNRSLLWNVSCLFKQPNLRVQGSRSHNSQCWHHQTLFDQRNKPTKYRHCSLCHSQVIDTVKVCKHTNRQADKNIPLIWVEGHIKSYGQPLTQASNNTMGYHNSEI